MALGVCFTSLRFLLLEIPLTRIFSFTIWYHFTYLTISVALLEFGAAGLPLPAFPRLLGDKAHRCLSTGALVAGVAVFDTIGILPKLKLDTMRILGEEKQVLSLEWVLDEVEIWVVTSQNS